MHASNPLNSSLAFRLLVDAFMILCAYLGWWYVALPIGAIAFFRFPYYFELVAAGFAYDALYGIGLDAGFAAAYAGTLITAAMSAAGAFFKGSFRREVIR